MNKQAFRRGFLYAMAANGLTPEIAAASIEKQAVTNIFGIEPIEMLRNAGRSAVGAGDLALATLAAGVATAGIGGGALAYGLLNSKADRENRLKDLKDKERIDTMTQEILRVKNRLRRRGARRPLAVMSGDQ